MSIHVAPILRPSQNTSSVSFIQSARKRTRAGSQPAGISTSRRYQITPGVFAPVSDASGPRVQSRRSAPGLAHEASAAFVAAGAQAKNLRRSHVSSFFVRASASRLARRSASLAPSFETLRAAAICASSAAQRWRRSVPSSIHGSMRQPPQLVDTMPTGTPSRLRSSWPKR